MARGDLEVSNYYELTTVPELARRQVLSALETRAAREIPDTTTKWLGFDAHLIDVSKQFPKVVLCIDGNEEGHVWATAYHAGVRVWEWERQDKSPPLPDEIRGLAGYGSEHHALLGRLPLRGTAPGSWVMK